MTTQHQTDTRIRPAAVAGHFYPAEADKLRQMINDLMREAPPGAGAPKALIAPHAGYIYSGPTAAIAYAQLQPRRDHISRVVLLGPAHRVYVNGLALSSATHFSTPLGDIEIDRDAVEQLKKLPQVVTSDAAHEQEHSLEVHLPFLQMTLKQFTLVPLVVGEASPKEVAEVLELLWGGEETIIIISSDLSHYHDYHTARQIDAITTQAIEQLQLEIIGPRRACGCMPVRGLIKLARDKHLMVKTLDVRNSGDTAGTKDRVVGYGAWSFTVPEIFAHEDESELLKVARASILHGLERNEKPELSATDFSASLRAIRATFVTLKLNKQLRGCIGTTKAIAPLVTNVNDNAFSAAFRDPRFKPLIREEFDKIHISISILTPSTPIKFDSETELLTKLRPEIDGLIIEKDQHRATYLPSVWEQLSKPEDFLRQLKLKAGMRPEDSPFRAWRYQSISIEE